MGWWSESIMGGDDPLDVRGDFEDQFATGTLSAEDGFRFLTRELKAYDDPVTKQVVGYLLIERGAPLDDRVRDIVLEGIAEELAGESHFSDVAARRKVLLEFAEIVETYPAEGARVALPHQPGLFETILGL